MCRIPADFAERRGLPRRKPTKSGASEACGIAIPCVTSDQFSLRALTSRTDASPVECALRTLRPSPGVRRCIPGVDGDVRTAWPVAHVFGQGFFTAVWRAEAGLDRNEGQQTCVTGQCRL